ncbi:hypothetical protein [Methyloprofundus sedimenti]|nr:hypothetical protein [Methyloprofundus sedimenti]
MRTVYIIFLCILISGCFNPGMMIDGRTALEQQLTRGAILRAVHKLPILKAVRNGRWKITVVSPDTHDDSWTHAQLRQYLISLGVDIATNASENLPVIEAVLQFAGSDTDPFIIGFPIPGSMGTSSVSLFHDNAQRGRAQIQLNFWTSDGRLIAQTPTAYAETHYSDITFLLFIGPFSFTDLNNIDTYGRFINIGEDTWELTKKSFTDTHGVVTNDWIVPENKPDP